MERVRLTCLNVRKRAAPQNSIALGPAVIRKPQVDALVIRNGGVALYRNICAYEASM
jgi:hypothetical protein